VGEGDDFHAFHPLPGNAAAIHESAETANAIPANVAPSRRQFRNVHRGASSVLPMQSEPAM
jgi:hypothetical protein